MMPRNTLLCFERLLIARPPSTFARATSSMTMVTITSRCVFVLRWYAVVPTLNFRVYRIRCTKPCPSLSPLRRPAPSNSCALAAEILSGHPYHTVIDVPGPDLPYRSIEEFPLTCVKQILNRRRLREVTTFE
jgi:hypothetical protein